LTDNLARFFYEPDPENPGWHVYRARDPESFAHVIAPLTVRVEDGPDGTPRLRLRMMPSRKHCNMLNTLHGGAMMLLVDLALFAAIRLILDGDGDGAVTLDLSQQFLSAGKFGKPVDAVVEVLRETGRLVFFRGLVEQESTTLAAFSATVRKPSKR
jgi:uncharacterized protein (TIGR00369 family)